MRVEGVGCGVEGVGCTPDPMSRDGKPNRLMQKLLRELGAIDTVRLVPLRVEGVEGRG